MKLGRNPDSCMIKRWGRCGAQLTKRSTPGTCVGIWKIVIGGGGGGGGGGGADPNW